MILEQTGKYPNNLRDATVLDGFNNYLQPCNRNSACYKAKLNGKCRNSIQALIYKGQVLPIPRDLLSLICCVAVLVSSSNISSFKHSKQFSDTCYVCFCGGN